MSVCVLERENVTFTHPSEESSFLDSNLILVDKNTLLILSADVSDGLNVKNGAITWKC